MGSVNGHYTLSSRRDPTTGNIPVFACRTQSISPDVIVLTAPVTAAPGEWLTVHFEPFGILRAQVERQLPDGFVATIAANEAEQETLAVRINWVKKQRIRAVADKREYKRILPRDPRAVLTLADGRQLACFIIDMSCTGVAFSADVVPEQGDAMAVGRVGGRVVRRLPVGFALRFDAVQPQDGLEVALRSAPDARAKAPDTAVSNS